MGSGTETWRRPIIAHAEEGYGLHSGAPQRIIKWYIEGEHQAEDADRLRLGLACHECLTTFPAAPRIENLRTWRDFAREWAPLRTYDEVLALVSQSRCPTCKSEVSAEMHAVSFQGMDPHAPTPLRDIVGDI